MAVKFESSYTDSMSTVRNLHCTFHFLSRQLRFSYFEMTQLVLMMEFGVKWASCALNYNNLNKS